LCPPCRSYLHILVERATGLPAANNMFGTTQSPYASAVLLPPSGLSLEECGTIKERRCGAVSGGGQEPVWTADDGNYLIFPLADGDVDYDDWTLLLEVWSENMLQDESLGSAEVMMADVDEAANQTEEETVGLEAEGAEVGKLTVRMWRNGTKPVDPPPALEETWEEMGRRASTQIATAVGMN
jgi:hypothetical protein